MPLLDIFKKKKPPKEKEPEKEKKPEKKPTKKSLVAETGKEKLKAKRLRKESPRPKKVKKTPDLAYKVLASPHITEKATDLGSQNKYVFKVFPSTSKTEIKMAIEQVYGVDVLKVRTINIPKKPKRWGKTTGWKKGYKKAIVKIKEGQKIEITPR